MPGFSAKAALLYKEIVLDLVFKGVLAAPVILKDGCVSQGLGDGRWGEGLDANKRVR